MVYSKLSYYLTSIDQCSDTNELINQYLLIRNDYDLAGWEADKNCLVAEDDYHDAYMKVLWSVMEMFKIRIENLGGQLPGYGD